MSLADALNTASTPLASPPPALRTPRVVYDAGKPKEVVTGDVAKATTQAEYRDRIRVSCEVDIPEGCELQLVEAWHNTSAWTRASVAQELAVSAPTWRYHFKVVPSVSPLDQRTVVTELAKYVRSRRPTARKGIASPHAEVVNPDLLAFIKE